MVKEEDCGGKTEIACKDFKGKGEGVSTDVGDDADKKLGQVFEAERDNTNMPKTGTSERGSTVMGFEPAQLGRGRIGLTWRPKIRRYRMTPLSRELRKFTQYNYANQSSKPQFDSPQVVNSKLSHVILITPCRPTTNSFSI